MKADEEFVAYMEMLQREKKIAVEATSDAIGNAFHSGALFILDELLDIAKN